MGRLEQMALRLLLQGAENEPVALEGSQEQEAEEDFSDSTKSLRIASIFIILAAGMIGGIPPLFSKAFETPGHPLPRILRAMSAGIILSLACIHIFPEAVLEMEVLTELMGEYPYNPAGACAVFGALIMVFMENVTHFFMDKRARAASLAAASTPSKHGSSSKADVDSLERKVSRVSVQQVSGILVNDPHTHVCAGQAHMMLNGLPAPTARDQVVAFLFELGCIFHSFIIGLTLGVNTQSLKEVRALLIALCFHQLLEGIALGSFIMRAQLSRVKGISMVMLYSLTCPIGIAIGMGIASTYDAESTKAIATQGVFNGISAGMLLYISLVQLIAEDFSRREIPPPAPACLETPRMHAHAHGELAEHAPQAVEQNAGESGWLLAGCHGALFFGAACMALLAIWA